MTKIVFLPDLSVDRDGDIFTSLVAELGLTDFEIDGDPETADFIAYVGRERAEQALGRRVKTGFIGDNVYVLPSTAPEQRGRFFEGQWRNFAAHVLGKDLAVRDEFKGLPTDEVKARLDARRFDFGVCIANIEYDFNLGTVIRNANAFLAREVLIYGRKKTDLRGAMGAQNYETLTHVPDLEALQTHVAERGYTIVCLEETEDAVALSKFEWPSNPLMVFGQEGPGIPDELQNAAHVTVKIPLHGSMRSINVGVAAGIAMYDWHAKR